MFGISQTEGIFDVNWTLISNTNLKVKKVKGDSLVFAQDDSTDYNPKITLKIGSNGEVATSYVSFIYPTTAGVVASRAEPEPIFHEHKDTVISGDSTIVSVTKKQLYKVINQPPAFAFMSSYTLEGNVVNFELSISGIGDDSTVSGPFKMKLANNKLILIKL